MLRRYPTKKLKKSDSETAMQTDDPQLKVAEDEYSDENDSEDDDLDEEEENEEEDVSDVDSNDFNSEIYDSEEEREYYRLNQQKYNSQT